MALVMIMIQDEEGEGKVSLSSTCEPPFPKKRNVKLTTAQTCGATMLSLFQALADKRAFYVNKQGLVCEVRDSQAEEDKVGAQVVEHLLKAAEENKARAQANKVNGNGADAS
jgi:hypothetical protein